MEVGKVYYQVVFKDKLTPILVKARLQRVSNGWHTWSHTCDPPDSNWKERGRYAWRNTVDGAVVNAKHKAILRSEGVSKAPSFSFADDEILYLGQLIEVLDRLREISKSHYAYLENKD